MDSECAIGACENPPSGKYGVCRKHRTVEHNRRIAIAGWPTGNVRESLRRTANLLVMLTARRGASAGEIREALGVRTDRMVYRWLATIRSVEGLALESIDEEGELVAPRSCRTPRYRLAAPPWKIRDAREPLARRSVLPLPSASPATAKESRSIPRSR